MPSLLQVLEDAQIRERENCYSDYSFHLLIRQPRKQNLTEFPRLRELGISSLKIYMIYAALQLRDNEILDILLSTRMTGFTTMVHAENGDMLTWMTQKLEERQLYAPKYHAT